MRFHRVLLVVNPVARTVSKPTLAVIEKALSADFNLEVAETKEQGHANELATQAVHDGIDLVIVFSGDGTINEAVNALAGSATALAVLPGGATNVLVRSLGLPTDPVECTGVLIPKALDDEAFPLHLGRADGRYFAVNCGAGIDASAMKRLERNFPETKSKFDRAAFSARHLWSSPFVRWQGRLAEVSSLDVAVAVTRDALAQRGTDLQRIDQLVLGTTIPQLRSFYAVPWLASRLGMPGISGPHVAQAGVVVEDASCQLGIAVDPLGIAWPPR